MNLSNKKELASKALKVGKNRLIFRMDSLSDIKEAITRDDIKTLHQEGVIGIKPVKGRKKIVRRKTRRGPGKIKKTVSRRKQEYVKITRKLRKYIMALRNLNVIERELYKTLRKKIRMRDFASKASLRDYLGALNIDIGKSVEENHKNSKKTTKKSIKKIEKKTEGKSIKKTESNKTKENEK